MMKINDHLELGATSYCMERIREETKGLGRRDVKGYIRACFLFDS